MTRKRVYVASPVTKGDLAENVNRATAAFVELAKAGLAPWCPAWSVFSAEPAERFDEIDGSQFVTGIGTAAGAPGLTHADWLGVDVAWVGVADAVLRLPGESKGADMEAAHARGCGIPIFGTVAEVVAWAGREGR